MEDPVGFWYFPMYSKARDFLYFPRVKVTAGHKKNHTLYQVYFPILKKLHKKTNCLQYAN